MRPENNNNALLPRVEKVFFTAGDTVTVKHAIDNKPKMFVLSVDKLTVKEDDRASLLGVTCVWFSSDKKLQKERFSTKDLIKIEDKHDD